KTNGLTEGHNGNKAERLGVEGLLALIGTLPPTDPAAHIDLLIKETHALNAGRHSDDLAVLRLDWGSRPSGL
ncbi:SpoIIE family protein phosphatase, partial [Streptomyces sp. NPDC057757]|uniref:SpoIIE family protein phosphatase n=1 Tax=Streptomyces sp. NPDC057757 TaxID=3346241 RepID=UPI0036CE026C